MEGKLTIAVVFDTLKKVLFWLITGTVSLALVIIISLQIPGVQNKLKDQVLSYLNTRIGQSISLDKINIKWFDQITLKGLSIRDYHDSLLLHVSSADIDYSITDLLADNHLFLDDVLLSNGELNLINYEDSLDVNIVEFINLLKSLKNQEIKNDSTKQPLRISISQIELNNFGVRINNKKGGAQGLDDQIDFSDFKFNIREAGFLSFSVRPDTIEAIISYLNGYEDKTTFEVESFYSEFRLTNKQLSFNNFNLKTPFSELGDTLVLNYDSFRDLNQFNTNVTLKGDINNSRIDLFDLSYFGNMDRIHRNLSVNSEVSGQVANLSLKDLTLKYGQLSKLSGDVDFFGLPKIDEAFIDAHIQNALFHAEDFQEFLKNFTSNVDALGDIQFKGEFLGFLNDFVANGLFNTRQGSIQSDINLKFPEGFENAKYSGKLVLDNFNAGAFIKNSELLQRVNLNGRIDGEGLTVDNANFLLDAEITNTGFYGYQYRYIKANGRFAASYFQGSLYVDDPHCKVNGVGTLNLGVYPEEIEVRSFVDQLDLLALGLSKKDIKIKTSISANIKGLNIDSLVGRINLDSSLISYEDRTIVLDTIAIKSERNENQRKVNIELAEAALELKGDFYFSQLAKDINVIAREFKEYFNPEDYNPSSLYRKNEEVDHYALDLKLSYRNINPYLHFLTDNITISEGGVVEGTFYQRKNATLFLFTEIDSIDYNGVHFYENVVDINVSKDIDSLGVLANVLVKSDRQQWKRLPETGDLSVEAVWFNNQVTLEANIKQPVNNSSAQINAELALEKDQLVFNFEPSNMVAFGERWYFNPYNRIEFNEHGIKIEQLQIYHEEQSISLSGVYSNDEDTGLKLDFKTFELKSISPIVPVSLSGTLTSTIELKKAADNENFRLLSNLNLKSLIVDNLLIGNINGRSSWVEGLEALSVDLVVERASIRTINVVGFYYPYQSNNQLDVAIEFDQANIKILEPLFSSMFSNLDGSASGSIKVTGALNYPILNGQSRIEGGKFTFNYLKTNYLFNGNIGFSNESIRFDRVEIFDRDGERASLNGFINHKGFKRFNLGLNISATRFLFLNTTFQDNSLYYGSAKGTGDISVSGPVNDLLIKAKARTESGTKIFIPIADGNDIDQKEYINFADLSDTTAQVDIDEVVSNSISGVRLDFDLDITPDAYMELIFNIKTGDIIRGRGRGNINMSLDTQGEFQLFGDINITEGGYNFTIPNFINKEFTIQPGSTISWYGDPYAGVLDLKAIYRQMASLSDYYPSVSGDEANTQTSGRYPFLVVLGLTGDMLSPKIDFEIKIDETAVQQETSEQVALASINNNEQELKRQVFSLLILRKFSEQNGFSLGGGAVGSSLSEFLSNQFSYFISQVDENLEVDIDLSTYKDANAFNTFQLRLAYTFLDGRLRVSGGGLVSQGGSDAAPDNFIGNWSVRYLLTKDGHLRIKAFSQAKQRIDGYSNASANLYRETGVSFQYIKSFDEFSELLKKSRDESVQVVEDQPIQG